MSFKLKSCFWVLLCLISISYNSWAENLCKELLGKSIACPNGWETTYATEKEGVYGSPQFTMNCEDPAGPNKVSQMFSYDCIQEENDKCRVFYNHVVIENGRSTLKEDSDLWIRDNGSFIRVESSKN